MSDKKKVQNMFENDIVTIFVLNLENDVVPIFWISEHLSRLYHFWTYFKNYFLLNIIFKAPLSGLYSKADICKHSPDICNFQ